MAKTSKCTVKPLKRKSRKPPEYFLFSIQVTTVVYKKKFFKKNLWKQKVGRSKLIKNRSANDRNITCALR